MGKWPVANGVKRRWSPLTNSRSYLPALSLISILRFMRSAHLSTDSNAAVTVVVFATTLRGITSVAYCCNPSSSIIPERNKLEQGEAKAPESEIHASSSSYYRQKFFPQFLISNYFSCVILFFHKKFPDKILSNSFQIFVLRKIRKNHISYKFRSDA